MADAKFYYDDEDDERTSTEVREVWTPVDAADAAATIGVSELQTDKVGYPSVERREEIWPIRKGWIYFIETADRKFIKIGFTNKPVRRIKEVSLMLPSPYVLQFAGALQGTYKTERWLHMHFSQFRDQGEWFRESDSIRAFMDAFCLHSTPADCDPKPLPAPDLEKTPESASIAVRLGRRGGKKSAAGRMAKMTPEQRSEVARIAAAASAVVRSAKAAKKRAKKR